MTPNPQRGTPAGDATLAIQRLARQTRADVQELQTLYVLESLLARIAASEHRDDFVLKGGVLLAAYAARRPTKDIDLQATALANDIDDVAARVREVAAMELPDGVVFDLGSVSASVIRDEGEYTGARIKLVGRLGRARLTIGADVNFGDPISPAPSMTQIPPLVPLGQSPVMVLGYPLTMVLAEKIVTALDRGDANTRWRDFADVYTLVGIHRVPAEELTLSLEAVARFRRVELQPLLGALAQMPARAQPKWVAWRSRMHRERELPREFADVLAAVARFTDPVLDGHAVSIWDPLTAVWLP